MASSPPKPKRAAAARHPELLFFAPGAAGGRTTSTSFYACSLRDGEAPPAARELLTVADISAYHAVLSPTPCGGLTLIFDARASEYYLFNLSTGNHIKLPPCQPAAAIESMPTLPTLPYIGLGPPTSYLPVFTLCTPLELSTTGLGFDTATGKHKVVRLFKKRNEEDSCEVYTPRGPPGRWRPCFGRVPPCAASFFPALPPVFVNGYLYWLLRPAGPGEEPIHRILSFSMAAEQFGWVYVPPRLSSLMRHLCNLDGLLCAVFDERLFAGVRDELEGERAIVPLCSAGGKILLATGRHKVFAYDAERNTVERVFRMQDFIDVPCGYLQARLLLNVGLHDERIADVHRGAGGERRLQVKLGRRDSTVVKREASVEHHDDNLLQALDLFKELFGLEN
ncbi:hypothetical protein E2562_037552 [Oryza meyeriana var. granulata]|uniref:F-box associated beta-propeller type 3 domain-containing protein n=1 Tax=Oryza meyeriana var. granulata TaxID=110450 RepID=A0A6G1DT41_9ORYZ|nr:hypothetical protein E2562_037552 [Oryza meyeriana var. granulata]